MCHDPKLPRLECHAAHLPRQSQMSGPILDSNFHSQPAFCHIIMKPNLKETKESNLIVQEVTLVLLLIVLIFFILSTTYGSDFPLISMAGKLFAEMTVTESTPLKMTSRFLFVGVL